MVLPIVQSDELNLNDDDESSSPLSSSHNTTPNDMLVIAPFDTNRTRMLERYN